LLGVSVGATHVRAVLWSRGAIAWAGVAPYATVDDLADAIARLAGESGVPVGAARVVLERDVVQLRSVVPAPPLKPAALGRYVALEAPRLFRKNGAPLVTDGVRVTVAKDTAVLWAGATAEPVAQAVLIGCAQAGLVLEALGPAADVLPHALVTTKEPVVLSSDGVSELLDLGIGGVWRSRLVRNVAPVDGQVPSREFTRALAALGDEAPHFAAAYAAAVALPRLTLLPTEARAAQERRSRRRMTGLFALGAALWLLAAGTYVGRLAWLRHVATRSLGTAAPAVDSALTVRRELGLAEVTLATVTRADQGRSRHLALLAAVTRALGDSTYLLTLQVTPDGVVRLAGYAPVAARVVADLERVAVLRNVRLEGPVTREHGAGSTERDRFSIVARVEVEP
jgi:hypothetical protein